MQGLKLSKSLHDTFYYPPGSLLCLFVVQQNAVLSLDFKVGAIVKSICCVEAKCFFFMFVLTLGTINIPVPEDLRGLENISATYFGPKPFSDL